MYAWTPKIRKLLRRFLASVRNTFVADCPACHLHFYGYHPYGVTMKINNKMYRIVCHRCVQARNTAIEVKSA